ncbi:unnamed protein product [Linum tenue]|uniref:(S)-hydroxynitrile lyase n=1 Tax=Linum tenue TaxID=586396 RepID=A0AAV0KK01_9ROSI|nr:unnamed protein product [Linum tenue]
MEMESDSSKKHFVLVHTACHGAWVWYKLKPLLEAGGGHKVSAIDLAASGVDQRTIEEIGSVEEYLEPLLKLLESLPEGEKVILVGESCGGINITIAADKFPQRIAAAVYVNALMPDTQHKPSYVLDTWVEKFFSDWKDCEFSSYKIGNETIASVKIGHELMKQSIYQNSPLEDYELARMLTRKGSFFQDDLAKRNNFTEQGYGSVKRIYIYGEEDLILTKEFQLWQIENFKPDKVYAIAGGDHKLMFCKTKELLNCLLQIAATY